MKRDVTVDRHAPRARRPKLGLPFFRTATAIWSDFCSTLSQPVCLFHSHHHHHQLSRYHPRTRTFLSAICSLILGRRPRTSMLALAPPIQQHTAIPYSQSSVSSALRPSARVVSGPRRTPSYSVAAHSSSSTSFNVTAHNDNRSSTQEDSTSYRSGPLPSQLPQISQAASSSSHHNGDDHQGGSLSHPIPSAENIVPSPRFESEAREIDIHSYDPQDLLRLLASLLNQIATTNDNITGRDMHASTAYQSHPSSPNSPTYESHHPPIWRTLTTASRSALASNMSLTFHARNVPTISLEAYLLRILKYCPASNEVFLSLLVYFDRMSKLAKDACGRAFIIDSYNIHRLVIAGVTVASKFFSDVFYTNSRYAKVSALNTVTGSIHLM